MAISEIDIETIFNEPSLKGGEYSLWLRIFTLSFFELRNGRYSASAAESFLFDPENPFFDLVADELGYEPDTLRKRIREALRISAKNREALWQERIRARSEVDH